MKKPLKALIGKLLFYLLFLLGGAYFGLVGGDSPYGMVIPAFCTVAAISAVINCVREIRKSNDKNRIDFL